MALKIFAIGLLKINWIFISVKIKPNRFSSQVNVKQIITKNFNMKKSEHWNKTALTSNLSRLRNGWNMSG